MTDIQIRRQVAQTLHALQEDKQFRKLAEVGIEPQFERFGQKIGTTADQMFPAHADVDSIRQELGGLQAGCFGVLAPFRPFILKALTCFDD